jgi:hypothetical protein
MIMVLIAIGLPSNLFILIFPVDFFLDRIRTTVNVYGDSIGAAIVGKLCEQYLQDTPMPIIPTTSVNNNDNQLIIGGYQMLLTQSSAAPSPELSSRTTKNHKYEQNTF